MNVTNIASEKVHLTVANININSQDDYRCRFL